MSDCQGAIYIVRIPDFEDLVVGVFSSKENCKKFIENFPDDTFEVSCRKLDDVLPAICREAKLECRLFQDGKLIKSYEMEDNPDMIFGTDFLSLPPSEWLLKRLSPSYYGFLEEKQTSNIS